MRERGIEPPTRRVATPALDTAAVMAPGFRALPMVPAAGSGDIRIEVRRGNTAIKVDWPAQAAGDCAAFTRTLVRGISRVAKSSVM